MKCPKCGKKYKYLGWLKRHINFFHNWPGSWIGFIERYGPKIYIEGIKKVSNQNWREVLYKFGRKRLNE